VHGKHVAVCLMKPGQHEDVSADTSSVENLGGWLTTVVGRVCLDMLRSRRSRREEPLEAHLPEQIVGREDRADPERLRQLDLAILDD
jgi:DNA-directed RNA polymerase specialized sigma24 family protein